MENIVFTEKTNKENKSSRQNYLSTKIRRIQAIHGQRSLLLCIPMEFIEGLDISKGDYVKCTLINGQLVVEKADF
jgi:hypothetical protein